MSETNEQAGGENVRPAPESGAYEKPALILVGNLRHILAAGGSLSTSDGKMFTVGTMGA
jgi:hypothetical protein